MSIIHTSISPSTRIKKMNQFQAYVQLLEFLLLILHFHELTRTRHVLVKHGCPRRQQSQKMAKISKSYILTPPHPQGQVMSEKCEEPIDEITVQVWLLYHHPNFKYCTFLQARRNYRQTDRWMIRLLDAPGGPFRPGT